MVSFIVTEADTFETKDLGKLREDKLKIELTDLEAERDPSELAEVFTRASFERPVFAAMILAQEN